MGTRHHMIRLSARPPRWRRVFKELGFDDPRPDRDGRHASELTKQVASRSPRQLQVVVDTLSRSLDGFIPVLDRAVTARAFGDPSDNPDLREMERFLTVARDSVAAVLARRPHRLDDRPTVATLQASASTFAARLDQEAGARGLMRDLDQRVASDLWIEPAGRPATQLPAKIWPVATLVALAIAVAVAWSVIH